MESSGVRICDSHDEIAAFRKARVLSASEACYRAMGFTINSRRPNVITCHISLTPSTPFAFADQGPINGTTTDVPVSADFHADDESTDDTDSVARHGLNELGLYLIRPSCASEMTICQFWCHYYICGKSVRDRYLGYWGSIGGSERNLLNHAWLGWENTQENCISCDSSFCTTKQTLSIA